MEQLSILKDLLYNEFLHATFKVKESVHFSIWDACIILAVSTP